jgi:predicted dehydrogenase
MTENSPRPLNIGFIGGGQNSAIGLTHRIAVEMDRRFLLKAGCFSTHQNINHETGKAWGVDPDRIYDNWQALLTQENKRLDAIAVLTPIPSHAEIVIHALDLGYPVISEKPLASSSADAGKIRKIIERDLSFLALTYNYSGYPMLRELQVMIQRGQLGKIIQVHAEMPQEGYIRLNKEGKQIIPQAWRLKDPETLSTVSMDLGAHLHHLIFFLTGARPIEVAAIQNSFGSFQQIIDNGICLIHYSNDIISNLWFSKCALGHRNGLRIRVYGTQGSAEWFQMTPEYLQYANQMGQISRLDRTNAINDIPSQNRYNRFKAGHPAGFIEAFANVYEDIADSLIAFHNNENILSPCVFGADIAEEGLHLLESIYRSSQTKSWEKVQPC